MRGAFRRERGASRFSGRVTDPEQLSTGPSPARKHVSGSLSSRRQHNIPWPRTAASVSASRRVVIPSASAPSTRLKRSWRTTAKGHRASIRSRVSVPESEWPRVRAPAEATRTHALCQRHHLSKGERALCFLSMSSVRIRRLYAARRVASACLRRSSEALKIRSIRSYTEMACLRRPYGSLGYSPMTTPV